MKKTGTGLNALNTACEAAGSLGLSAVIALFAMLFARQPMTWVWAAAGVSLAGNLIYITHVFARRATGHSAMTWRELVLANIAPATAVVVTAIMIGQFSGLFHLPIGPSPEKHMITRSPGQGSSAR